MRQYAMTHRRKAALVPALGWWCHVGKRSCCFSLEICEWVISSAGFGGFLEVLEIVIISLGSLIQANITMNQLRNNSAVIIIIKCLMFTWTGGKLVMKLAGGCTGGFGVIPITGGAATGMAMDTGGWVMMGCWCWCRTAGIAIAGRLGTGGVGNWLRMSKLMTVRPPL